MWFDEKNYGSNTTRSELASNLGVKQADLFWAFAAGWRWRYDTLTTDDI